MALEGMHDALLDYLKAQGAVQFTIESWENLWWQAQNFPGEPLPCPSCFLDGRVQRLMPLKSAGEIGAVRCEACKTKFEFPGG
ncbi:hypothetical protein [Variovorax sp. WS11]|uniref:hypothetical protein n=1 Tax=Variovorax sp. WS11 TaxID=1105204 RepID=UPI0011B20B2C|nr:hypothetical protein [Variovorax sp. WS11]